MNTYRGKIFLGIFLNLTLIFLTFIGINFTFANESNFINEGNSADEPGSAAWLAAEHPFSEWADYIFGAFGGSQLFGDIQENGKIDQSTFWNYVASYQNVTTIFAQWQSANTSINPSNQAPIQTTQNPYASPNVYQNLQKLAETAAQYGQESLASLLSTTATEKFIDDKFGQGSYDKLLAKQYDPSAIQNLTVQQVQDALEQPNNPMSDVLPDATIGDLIASSSNTPENKESLTESVPASVDALLLADHQINKSTADTPDIPDTSNTSDNSDTSDTPDTPDTSDTPDTPDTSDTPDNVSTINSSDTTAQKSSEAALAAAKLQPIVVGNATKDAVLSNQNNSNILYLGQKEKPTPVLIGKQISSPAQNEPVSASGTVNAPDGSAVNQEVLYSYTDYSSIDYTSTSFNWSSANTNQNSSQTQTKTQTKTATQNQNTTITFQNTSQNAIQTSNTEISSQLSANQTATNSNQTQAENSTVLTEAPNILTPAPAIKTVGLTIDQTVGISLNQNGNQFTVRLKADKIDKADFYIQSTIAGSPQIYLGAGILNSASGFWEFTFDSSNYPNGDYDLFAVVASSLKSFQSNKFRFTISNASAGDINQQNTRVEQLIQAQQTVNSKIDEIKTITTTAQAQGRVLAASPSSAVQLQDQIQKFSGTVEKIKQLQNILSQVETQKSEIEADINRVKQKIAALSPQTSSTIINDLGAEIKHLINQKATLDNLSINLQEQINVEQKNRNDALDTIVNLTESKQRENVKNQMLALETSISQKAQEAIDAQNELKKDSDNDGLSDYDELFVYKTNPYNPDTDSDGFLDGDEATHGFKPLDPNDHKQIVFKDPRIFPPQKTKIYTIDSVSSVTKPNNQIAIKLTGKGLPNSYLNLFIFSQPIIITVKTDSQGRWEYVLEQAINDGYHEVYAAQINSEGELQGRSEVFVFMKNGSEVLPSENEITTAPSTLQQIKNNFGFYTICIILIGIGGAFLAISAAVRKTNKTDIPKSPYTKTPF